jgi:hypothetical protein
MAKCWVAGSSSTPSVELGPYKMSTFGGSSNVEVRMLYSIWRDTSNYTVYYNVQFHRTNTGYTTGAYTRCSIFVGSTLKAKATPVDVSTSNSTWKTAGSGSFSVGLDSTSTASITLGFATSSSTNNLDTSNKSNKHNANNLHYYSSPAKSTGSISIPKAVDYTACGVPSNLSITNNDNSTVTLSVKAGANGTSNNVNALELFVSTYGTTPTTSSYTYKIDLAATAGNTYTHTLDFRELYDTRLHYAPQNPLPVKFTARTCGAAGESYYSALATVVSSNVECVYKPDAPHITKPDIHGEFIEPGQAYIVRWTQPNELPYRSRSYYSAELKDLNTNELKFYEQLDAKDRYWHIPGDCFEVNHDYIVEVYYVDYPTNSTDNSRYIKGISAHSTTLYARDIRPLESPMILIDDTNCAIPATHVLSYRRNRENLYLDIGSGNVCHISWNACWSQSETARTYGVKISACDNSSAFFSLPTYYTSAEEFYITSEHMARLRDIIDASGDGYTDVLLCQVEVEAHSRFGELFNSVCDPSYFAVCKAAGMSYPSKSTTLAQKIYANEEDKYITVPTIQRSVAFSNVNGKWVPVSDFYMKEAQNGWVTSDISYETLVDENGSIIVDINEEPVFIK